MERQKEGDNAKHANIATDSSSTLATLCYCFFSWPEAWKPSAKSHQLKAIICTCENRWVVFFESFRLLFLPLFSFSLMCLAYFATVVLSLQIYALPNVYVNKTPQQMHLFLKKSHISLRATYQQWIGPCSPSFSSLHPQGSSCQSSDKIALDRDLNK